MTPARGDDGTRTYVQFSGVHVPGWLAAAVAIALLLSALAFLLSLFLIQDIRSDHQREEEALRAEIVDATKEIRILQLHAQDIQSVLIQQGLAKRQDFAPWGPDAPTHDPNRR